jgi:hypothetical protein
MSVPNPGARRRLATAATALLCLALAVPAAGAVKKPKAATTASVVAPDFFGVNANFFGRPDTDQEAQLTSVAATGVRVIRHQIKWKRVEPLAPDPVTGAHAYDWVAIDDAVASAARHGIEIQPVVGYSTSWASPAEPLEEGRDPTRVRPGDRASYLAYAVAIARRYGRSGEFWGAHPELPRLPFRHYEIWNEQNDPDYWRPQATAPEDYADLYAASRVALRRVDPRAEVIVGGLVERDAAEFVRRMAKRIPRFAGKVDGIAYHVYSASTAQGVIASVRGFRRSLTRLGLGDVPIELNEVGWSRIGISDAGREQNFLRLARDLPHAGLGVSRLMPYVWWGGDIAIDFGTGLGMAWSDGRLMSAGTGYATGIASARARAATASVRPRRRA